MRKLCVIALAIFCLAACKPNVKLQLSPSAGTANFTTYLAVGNSLTAGYADGTLYKSGQQNSYPKRLSEQFALVGMKGLFVQPLMPGNAGYPSPKFVLGLDTISCTGSVSLGPRRYSGTMDTTGSLTNISALGPFNNLGVPGIRAVDYDVPDYAQFAYSFGGAPYALRMYSDVTHTPLQELIYTVGKLNPTFFTLWLGANDVLGYSASGGGQGNGDGTAVPLIGNLYSNTDISPDSPFYKNYDATLNALLVNGAKGALINIPDVTSIPFFNTIPINSLPLRSGQADTLTAFYGAQSIPVSFHEGLNYLMVQDHNGNTRQALPGELVLLDCPQDSLICAGWGSIKPIPADYVLTTDEIANARNATNRFNAFIASEATKYNLALVDMHSYLSTVYSGIVFNGVTYNAQFVTGGAFSLDGVHLTPRGYAIVANYIIQNINGHYKSTIPVIDVNQFNGVLFP